MAYGDGWTMDDVEMLMEIRGLYDGWSAAYLKDGRLVNRWSEDDYRFKATQEWIDQDVEDK